METVRKIGSLPIRAPGDSRQNLKILLYGSSGVGKTVLAASAQDDPRTTPVLLIDFEGGTLSVSDKAIDVVRITDFKQLDEIYAFLSKNRHYKTVIIDSVTELQKLNMSAVLAEKRAEVPQIADWGKSALQMRKLIRYFRDLPLHLIMTALPQESKDERDGTIAVKPALSGKLADEIPGLFDIVGYLGVTVAKDSDTASRKLLVTATPKFVAKDRSNRLGSIVTDPTIPKLLDLIFSSKPKPAHDQQTPRAEAESS